jgi:hypothetical protein
MTQAPPPPGPPEDWPQPPAPRWDRLRRRRSPAQTYPDMAWGPKSRSPPSQTTTKPKHGERRRGLIPRMSPICPRARF